MVDETKTDIDQIAEDILNSDTSLTTETQVDSFSESDIMSSDEADIMAENAMAEQKYGDQNLRTFVERAASAASFGLTDQALVKGAEILEGKKGKAEMRKGLAEREARNREAAIAGEVAGVVAPSLMTGGTSLAAKGLSAGVKTAAKAGAAAERAAMKFTSKQLASMISRTGREKAAREVIVKSLGKSAGLATEGLAYGGGQLIKEDALGTGEFNAENVIATLGTSALLGGVAGGVLGSSSAMIPVVKNNRVVDVVRKKINNVVDKNQAAARIMGLSARATEKLKSNPWTAKIHDNFSDFFKNRLKLQKFDSLEKLSAESAKQVKIIGNEIVKITDDIDKAIKTKGIRPTRSRVANTIITDLENLKSGIKSSPGTDDILNLYDDEILKWNKWSRDARELSAKDMRMLKKNLQDLANYRRATDTIKDQETIRRSVAKSVRQEFVDLADRVSTTGNPLGEQLRKANLDYATSLEVAKNLASKEAKLAQRNFLSMRDVLVADILIDVAGGSGGLATSALVGKKLIESDFINKLTILSNIEKANQKVGKKLAKGVENFFTKAKRAAVPASTKALLNTNFRITDDGKKPKKHKDKKEAFKAVSADLVELSQNPEKLINHLSKNAFQTTNAAPATAAAMSVTVANAVRFLFEKMPRDASAGGALFNRKWEPSSIELAKFERYLAAVENPMSVIDDLESGTLTREGVEALQRVYPDLYQRMHEQVTEHISENQDLAYDKRVQLGILLDIPADSSMLPSNIAALQQTFYDKEQQRTAAVKEEGVIETTQAGLENISMADDAKTESERIATRKTES